MSTYDPLSGLFSREEFLDRLEVAVAAAHRHQYPLSLCLFDLDDFKQVNETHGPAAGDEVIHQVGKLIRREIRTDDLAGRYGGDAFCIALSHTPAAQAGEVVERIRSGLAQLVFRDPEGRYFQVSACFGVCDMDPEKPARAVLTKEADRAVSRAKGGGRNRVEVRASCGSPPATQV